jgi:KaiC/GvpD/RAD55 family RecA-like ATPase
MSAQDLTNDQDPANPMPRLFVAGESHPQEASKEGPRPFPLWTLDNFDAYTPTPGRDILGEAILRRESICLLMGQPGLGKSSFALALAVANVKGETDFAGIPLHPVECRWLFIGNENGKDRWKADLDAIAKTLDPEKREALRERVIVAATFDDDASDLTLTHAEGRIRETVKDAQADVVVLDPWGDLVEDEIKSDVVRAAIHALRRAVRGGNRNAATLLICHAKTGREAVADFVGNFGGVTAQRGNRMLISSARAALLLVPHDEESGDLVLALAKCNDGPGLAPRRVRLDRNAWRVILDSEFDIASWKDGLRAKASKPRKVPLRELYDACGEECRTRADFVKKFKGRASERSVGDALAEAVANRVLEKTGTGPATRYNRGPNCPSTP